MSSVVSTIRLLAICRLVAVQKRRRKRAARQSQQSRLHKALRLCPSEQMPVDPVTTYSRYAADPPPTVRPPPSPMHRLLSGRRLIPPLSLRSIQPLFLPSLQPSAHLILPSPSHLETGVLSAVVVTVRVITAPACVWQRPEMGVQSEYLARAFLSGSRQSNLYREG